MRINMGTPDRIIRALIAVSLVILGLWLGPTGRLAVGLYAIAAMLLFTSVVSWCPAYHVLGLRTCRLPASR